MYRVIRGGCNTRHPSTFQMNRPNGMDNYVLLIIKSPCVFTVDGTEYEVVPDTGIILSKGISYSYGNPNGEYMDDWLHFMVDDNDFGSGAVKTDTFFKLSDTGLFTNMIRQLIFENYYTNEKFKQENTDYLMRVLMNHIEICCDENLSENNYGPYYSKLRGIRILMQESMYNPKKAPEYADQLGISTSHFQHLYKEYFGISFQKDFIRMRIDFAKDLLETTDMPMERVAEMCGYNNEMHFYRQFKESVNQTPANYRKHFRNLLF